MWSAINAISGGLFCDRVGRRPLFLISTAGMLVFFILQTVCSAQFALHGNKAAGNAVIAFLCECNILSTPVPDTDKFAFLLKSCTVLSTPSRTPPSSRHTHWRFCRSTSALRVTPFLPSQFRPRSYSTNILTRSHLPPCNGSTTSCTACGSPLSLCSSGSSWSRQRTGRWKRRLCTFFANYDA